jgi:hypothetical protein
MAVSCFSLSGSRQNGPLSAVLLFHLSSAKHHQPFYCQPDVVVPALAAAATVHSVFISLKFEKNGVLTERRFIRTKVDQNGVFMKGSLKMK